MKDCINAAIRLHASQRFEEALSALQPLLQPHAQSADAWNLAAACLSGLNHKAEAQACWEQVIRLRPDYVPAYRCLGLVLMERGLIAEAETACLQALNLYPGSIDIQSVLAAVMIAQRRFAESEQVYRQMLTVVPNDVYGWCNLALVLNSLDRPAESEAACRKALAINPDLPDALNNLGAALGKLDRWSEAEDTCRRVLAIRPDHAAISNLATVILEQGRVAEAMALYGQVLELRPDLPEVYNNLGLGYDQLGLVPQAEAAYREALKLDAGYADAKLNLAMLLLADGRFQEGWKLYEARHDPRHTRRNTFAPSIQCPQWQGQPLSGRALLVWYEQGAGDMIQFARYIPALREQGARVTMVCQPALQKLFSSTGEFDVVDEDNAFSAKSAHQYWTFAGSLPLHFGTTVESIPRPDWLTPDPSLARHWREALGPLNGKRIGLVWKGNPKHVNDRNRSLRSLATLAPLWNIAGLSFVSLQCGAGEDEPARLQTTQPIINLGSAIRDFADTAAIVTELDLVICVDTAVAHLAGALDKTCWVLLPASGTDWRWMRPDQDPSPWYPQLRLFRQKAQGDWPELIGRLCSELEHWAKREPGVCHIDPLVP